VASVAMVTYVGNSVGSFPIFPRFTFLYDRLGLAWSVFSVTRLIGDLSGRCRCRCRLFGFSNKSYFVRLNPRSVADGAAEHGLQTAR
jgi:hypothetical protein